MSKLNDSIFAEIERTGKWFSPPANYDEDVKLLGKAKQMDDSEKNLIELIDLVKAAKLLQKNRKECAEWLKGKDAFWIVSEKGADDGDYKSCGSDRAGR